MQDSKAHGIECWMHVVDFCKWNVIVDEFTHVWREVSRYTCGLCQIVDENEWMSHVWRELWRHTWELKCKWAMLGSEPTLYVTMARYTWGSCLVWWLRGSEPTLYVTMARYTWGSCLNEMQLLCFFSPVLWWMCFLLPSSSTKSTREVMIEWVRNKS